MTDEQFALFIADNGRRSPQTTMQAAEEYLKWLESKKPKVASISTIVMEWRYQTLLLIIWDRVLKAISFVLKRSYPRHYKSPAPQENTNKAPSK